MAKFLGETGLTYLWGKIKNWVSNYVKITSSTGKDTITAGNNSIDVYDWAQASSKPSYTMDEVADGTTYKRFSATEQSKLSGIAAGAEANVQADWNETDTNSDAYIANKPTIPSGVSPYTNDPAMNGSASAGSSDYYSRGDHVHPTDTSRAPAPLTITVSDTGPVTTGTYNSVIAALTAGKDVIIKYDDGTGSVYYCDFVGLDDMQGYCHFQAVDDNTSYNISLRYTDTVSISIGTYARSSHTHGNIQSGGALQTNDVSIASGDKLVITDSSDSSKIARASISFDASTTTKALTPKGTWETFLNSDNVGVANGICPLDANVKIDASYLPSYVDDVIEAYIRSGQTALSSTWLATGSASGTVITPEAGKIYVLMNSDSTYPENTEFRWGGSTYVKINDGGIAEMTTSEMDAATDNWA